MIRVNEEIAISEEELKEKFVRSSGPGGQNVNKVATAVQLRFNAATSPNLPDWLKPRLMRLAGARLTLEGEIVIEADTHRTREQNRAEALARLVSMIDKASRRPKKRIKTRPTLASKARRITAKKARGEIKQGRRKVSAGD